MLGGPDYLARLNAPTPWTREVVASFRNVARSICRVIYSGGIGQGGVMLTLRFDVEADAHVPMADAFCKHLLPPLLDRVGIAGVHLCIADEAVSRIETAEKKARADATAVPAWIVLIEGISAPAVGGAAEVLEAAMRSHGLDGAPDKSVYQLEHTRCKTAGSAG